MGLIAWLILGGIAGWLASIVMGKNASMGLLANVVVGVIGAILGGWIFSLMGGRGVSGLNFYSLFVAVVGACLLLWIVRAVRKP